MGKLFLGVDFAPDEIRICAVSRKWGRLQVEGYWRRKAATDQERQDCLAAVCQELSERGLSAVAGLPRGDVLYREFTLPPLAKSAVCQAVGYQLLERSPFEAQQLRFAYQLKEIPSGWQVQALAVPREELERLSTIFSRAGCGRIAFVPSGHAMALLAGRDCLAGRAEESLELGLADSWWGRDLPLAGSQSQRREQIAAETEKTLSFLEAQTGRKLKLRLAGSGDWQPALAGRRLEPSQFLAAALAAAGAQGKTVALRAVGEKENSWPANPFLVASLCLWLAVAAASCRFAMGLRSAQSRLAELEARQTTQSAQVKPADAKYLDLLSAPPQGQLQVLRQLSLAAEGGESYHSLVMAQGRVKGLEASGQDATSFIRRLRRGPLERLSLAGPIVQDQGKESFTLSGPVEARADD